MNAALNSKPIINNEAWNNGVSKALERIAPAWPLDDMIAVNPLWGFRDLPMREAVATATALGNVACLAPDALDTAAQALPADTETPAPTADGTTPRDNDPSGWYTLGMLLDEQRDTVHGMAWQDEIINQISRFCAQHTEDNDLDSCNDLYAKWLDTVRRDRGLPILMHCRDITPILAALPNSIEEVFACAQTELGVNPLQAEHYSVALLMDINGWASRYAWVRWQVNLQGGQSDGLRQLLGIRAAWDLALWRLSQGNDNYDFTTLRDQWQQQLNTSVATIESHQEYQRQSWAKQEAAESNYQRHLMRQIHNSRSVEGQAPLLQAVFCIDVRSEVIRRHLELQSPNVETRGFAGFFGLPVAVANHAYPGSCRSQLPGLLAPALTVRPSTTPVSSASRSVNAGLHRTANNGAAIFGLVEAMGLGYAFKLLRESINPRKRGREEFSSSSAMELCNEDGALDDASLAGLVAGILSAMGVTADFAPWVMLTGHASQSQNNPHAASLDCGACGGHSGEINVRILCQVLNKPSVREHLHDTHDIIIPDTTTFVPALHNTTTDAIKVLEGSLPDNIQQWLGNASTATRQERAEALGLACPADQLEKKLHQRANDWSQVRPEWGLAGNAAFIVAPRSLTRGKNLEGRVFLHDYSSEQDPEFSTLELILTAPVVVAHWINSQYNASLADNRKFGSGNKILHNVVGGNVGILEGGSGDLRIGLPMQSLHDGTRWMHTPLRLSVYVQAPESAIEDIYQRHEVVRQLVDNEWLYLFALNGGTERRLFRGDWVAST